MKLPSLASDHGRRHKAMSLLLAVVLALSLGALDLGLGLSTDPRIERMDQPLHDAWVRRDVARASLGDLVSPAVQERLVLVVIDRPSVEAWGWPLPRGVYAELVRRLERAGARTIGLDILFGTAGAGDEAANASLRETLARPTVVVPYELVPKEDGFAAAGLYPPLVQGWTTEDWQRRAGFSRELPDHDNQVRRALVQVGSFQSFDSVLVAHFLGVPPAAVTARTDHLEPLPLGGATALVGIVDYLAADLEPGGGEAAAGSAGAPGLEVLPGSGHPIRGELALSDLLSVIPMRTLMEAPEEDLPGFFGVSAAGAPLEVLALVGVTVPGGYDLKASPVGPISGVAIHANILVNLLQDGFLHPMSPAESALMLVALALLAGVAGALLEARVAFVCAGLLFGLEYLAGAEAYRRMGVLLPFTVPTLGVLLQFGVQAVHNVTATRAARDRFARVLREVAPIPDLEALLGPRGLHVGSEERDLTILFSDIRGYTDLAESLDPVTVTGMLNEYHAAMGEVFDRHGGVVFDYQGDAQMVVFGLLPASQPNHAAAACGAAVGMLDRLAALRRHWLEEGRPVFDSAVGICSGPVAIGVLGSAQRKQYAAIGDATNTAARLQGKSQDLGRPILLAASTAERAGDAVRAVPLGEVQLKGKREPLHVYGLGRTP